DATTREQLIRSHQANVALNVSRQDLPSLTKSFGVHPVSTMNVAELTLNTKRPPTNNPLVRKALLYAFPEEDVIKTVYAGYAPKVLAFGPVGLWGTDLPLRSYTFDLNKAKEMLAQAGYANGGITLEFDSVTTAYPEERPLAELWKAALAQVGVTVNIKNISFNENVAVSTQPNPLVAPNAMILEWVPNYPSLQDYLF